MVNEHERVNSSSPEPLDGSRRSLTSTRDGTKLPAIRKQSLQELEYSGNEHGSYSDFSDTAPSRAYKNSSLSHSNSVLRDVASANLPFVSTSITSRRPEATRKLSQQSGLNNEVDDERVIWHGHLLCLKSKGGVRQWKKLWVVLRSKNLAFYKNEDVRFSTFLGCS